MDDCKQLRLLTLIALGLVITTMASAQTLTQAALRTHTDGEDKDHDTAVFVYVTESNGTKVIAQVAYAAASGPYGFADNEWHDIPVPLSGTALLTKAECQHFKYKIGIQAHGGTLGNTTADFSLDKLPFLTLTGGNDRWKFDGWLILTFSDGSTLSSDKLKQDMNSTGGKLVWLNLQ